MAKSSIYFDFKILYFILCFKADADHFMSLCQKRTPADTKLQLNRLSLRSLEKDKKKFRKKKGVKEHDNVMWDVLDPHR